MAETSANGGEATEPTKGGKLKLVIIAVAALVVLTGGGGAAAYFLGLFGGSAAHAEAPADKAPAAGGPDEHAKTGGHDGHGTAEAAPARPSLIFVDLPDLLVNLRSSNKRLRFLKLRVALEVTNETVAENVKALTPRIMDSFQLYLRALDADEIQGSEGMQRLKEEMLARVNHAIEPTRVSDVLFKEMLVQ